MYPNTSWYVITTHGTLWEFDIAMEQDHYLSVRHETKRAVSTIALG